MEFLKKIKNVQQSGTVAGLLSIGLIIASCGDDNNVDKEEGVDFEAKCEPVVVKLTKGKLTANPECTTKEATMKLFIECKKGTMETDKFKIELVKDSQKTEAKIAKDGTATTAGITNGAVGKSLKDLGFPDKMEKDKKEDKEFKITSPNAFCTDPAGPTNLVQYEAKLKITGGKTGKKDAAGKDEPVVKEVTVKFELGE